MDRREAIEKGVTTILGATVAPNLLKPARGSEGGAGSAAGGVGGAWPPAADPVPTERRGPPRLQQFHLDATGATLGSFSTPGNDPAGLSYDPGP